MKLTDHPSTYYDLTNFKSEVHTRTRNGKLRKSAETWSEPYFRRILSQLKPLCVEANEAESEKLESWADGFHTPSLV